MDTLFEWTRLSAVAYNVTVRLDAYWAYMLFCSLGHKSCMTLLLSMGARVRTFGAHCTPVARKNLTHNSPKYLE